MKSQREINKKEVRGQNVGQRHLRERRGKEEGVPDLNGSLWALGGSNSLKSAPNLHLFPPDFQA